MMCRKQRLLFPDEWTMAQPEWDGDPDSWEAYQIRVEEYLENRRRQASRSERPHWDGNPDTWAEFQDITQAWWRSRPKGCR